VSVNVCLSHAHHLTFLLEMRKTITNKAAIMEPNLADMPTNVMELPVLPGRTLSTNPLPRKTADNIDTAISNAIQGSVHVPTGVTSTSLPGNTFFSALTQTIGPTSMSGGPH
jgi:hypothetical protein